jgi:uncharacterized protein YdeI (YjbR/CyaY-like superfamily)
MDRRRLVRTPARRLNRAGSAEPGTPSEQRERREKLAGMTQEPPRTVTPRDRAQWRRWLERNHTKRDRVWLIYHKKGSGTPSITYVEAVEEALCFGWIDSTIRPIDETTYQQLFARRKPTSTWSKLNKERVERLIRDARMTEAGLASIEIAKRNGSWSSLDRVEALEEPSDLGAALDADPTARRHFDAFPASAKKMVLYRVERAKRPETRAKRIMEMVDLISRNERPDRPRVGGSVEKRKRAPRDPNPRRSDP